MKLSMDVDNHQRINYVVCRSDFDDSTAFPLVLHTGQTLHFSPTTGKALRTGISVCCVFRTAFFLLWGEHEHCTL